MLGIELDQTNYETLFRNAKFGCFTLNEMVDIAINDEKMNPGKNKIWEFAGAYYAFNKHNEPMLIIDREQTVGGYNNSELIIWDNEEGILFSNDKTFLNLVEQKIAEKQNIANL